MKERLLVRYDGYCRLCSGSVQWIIRNDVRKRFTFEAMSGHQQPGATVELIRGGRHFVRSNAILRIAVYLRFPWPLLGVFYLLPRFVRDALYRLVARNRKRWFGENDTCFIP